MPSSSRCAASVFRSPHDLILWDTGHQAYVHKILTGRARDFTNLREGGGLSGYPNRSESEHDWIENSHASTVLSYAHGLATAFEAADARPRIVAVIGDGAMTGGMAFEGLNNLGHAGSDVTIVLNDNGRSYAPTVSRLSESLVKIRNNPVYMRRQAKIKAIAERIPGVGEQISRGVRVSKAAVREMWEPSAFFEDLGVRYLGPFDGHDIASMEEAFENAAEFDGPVVVHVLTQKGKGFAPAEQDEIKAMHDAKPGLADNGGAAKTGSYTAAFSETLVNSATSTPSSWRSPPPCPTPPVSSPSANDSPIDASMSASPSSTPSRRQPAWRWVASARSSPSTRPSSPGRSTRSTSMSACTASP